MNVIIIDEGELVVEQYMAETNGISLKIVFPEYDKGNDK